MRAYAVEGEFTVEGRVFARADGSESKTLTFPVVTRTGTKVHLASGGSSVTHCGHWLKTRTENYMIEAEVTCERCIENPTWGRWKAARAEVQA